MVEDGEVRVVHRGGSKINFRKPVITNDSKFLLCASGDCVKVFSTSTEENVHDLLGHRDLVTGVVLNPLNHLQVYSCSLDGTVSLWDFTDGVLIKTYIIGHPIYSIHVSENHAGFVFVVVSKGNNPKPELVAVRLPRSVDQQVEAPKSSIVLRGVSPNPELTSFGREGEYIASAKGLNLDVFFFKKIKSYRISLKTTRKQGVMNEFTCVSCHPKEDCIATGHMNGQIRLWRNFGPHNEYTSTNLHWHHSVVNSLCFTPEGTNLLSGGIESVLVQWRYTQEIQRDFLPRLGATIAHIASSPDGTLICTSHSDNKITIIQSCKVSAVIQGLVRDEMRTGLMIDPRSKALVLNGKPGHLQFYSLQRDKQLYNLDIVQQEYVHAVGLCQFEVVNAAFDARGDWLATVEERRHDAELEINLKLWAYDEQTQSFVLSTTVAAPHEDRITAMCFCPSPETTMLVTSCQDGHFKAWLLDDQSDSNEDGGASWSCDFVGGYHHLTPQCCCFSADGSLLAVGFQEVVTVWSPVSWELLTTLSQPPGVLRNLCFGRLSCSKYLMGTTSKSLVCCWNLLTCTLEWSTSMDHVSSLLADPLSENMAIISYQAGSSDLFVFKPDDPRPLYCHKAVCVGKVQHAIFAPRDDILDSCEDCAQWLNTSQLYFLTQHMDLMTFTTKTEQDRLVASSQQLVIDDSVAVTPFYLLLGKHRRQQRERRDIVSREAERTPLPQGSVAIKELLHTPAHVLPAASFLCSMFVRSLLVDTAESREDKEPAEEETESEKEEEDSDEEGVPVSRQELLTTKQSAVSDSGAARLNKAHERELRRVKKVDYGWLSSLLQDS